MTRYPAALMVAVAPAVLLPAASAAGTAASAAGTPPFDTNWGAVHFSVGKACGQYHSGVGASAWQSVLWAAGNLQSTSDIDGSFGSGTTAATQAWQKARSLEPDGCVGYGTWKKAWNHLELKIPESQPYLTSVWKYRGDHGTVTWDYKGMCETWGFYNPRDSTEHYTYLSSVPGWCSYPGLGTPEYGTNTYFP